MNKTLINKLKNIGGRTNPNNHVIQQAIIELEALNTRKEKLEGLCQQIFQARNGSSWNREQIRLYFPDHVCDEW